MGDDAGDRSRSGLVGRSGGIRSGALAFVWNGRTGLAFAMACLIAGIAATVVLLQGPAVLQQSPQGHDSVPPSPPAAGYNRSTTSTTATASATAPLGPNNENSLSAGFGSDSSGASGGGNSVNRSVSDASGTLPNAPESAPEVPFSILIPVAAVAVLAGYAALRRRNESRRKGTVK
jgi:hypothetical protein